jgi:hypothetical protein
VNSAERGIVGQTPLELGCSTPSGACDRSTFRYGRGLERVFSLSAGAKGIYRQERPFARASRSLGHSPSGRRSARSYGTRFNAGAPVPDRWMEGLFSPVIGNHWRLGSNPANRDPGPPFDAAQRKFSTSIRSRASRSRCDQTTYASSGETHRPPHILFSSAARVLTVPLARSRN